LFKTGLVKPPPCLRKRLKFDKYFPRFYPICMKFGIADLAAKQVVNC